MQFTAQLHRGAGAHFVGCALVALGLIGCASAPPQPSVAGSTAAAVAHAPPKTPTTRPADVQPAATQTVPSILEPQQPIDSNSALTGTSNVQTTPPVASLDSGALALWQEAGIASWYGPRFHGKRTASGERFDTNALTAAHKTLPFGTRVRVKSVADGKEVVVRINDRGPHHENRLIDLSQAAARALGILQQGVAAIELQLAPADAREPQAFRAERKPLSSGHSRRAVGVPRKPARG